MSELKPLLAEPSPEPKCKGVVYKADVQHCKTQRGVLFSVRLNKMKRLSCPGCEQCGFLEDDLGEIDPKHWPIIGIATVEPGKLYTIDVVNIGRDLESGYVDAWDLKVTPFDG